tara:strand:+ start:869 stop:1348 length:480 start_codon:yes stop_codon:yes gene_type:complete
MPDYSKGKIYKLIDYTNGDIYIGSTSQSLAKRKTKHKTDSRLHDTYDKRNKLIRYSSHKIIKNNNYDIILIEDYPCNSKDELRMREQYWMDSMECINSQRAYRTKEQEKDYNKEYFKQRAIKDKEKLKKYKHDLFAYQSTWGGQALNNLLKIDINYFNY